MSFRSRPSPRDTKQGKQLSVLPSRVKILQTSRSTIFLPLEVNGKTFVYLHVCIGYWGGSGSFLDTLFVLLKLYQDVLCAGVVADYRNLKNIMFN